MNKVNLSKKFTLFSDYWSPKIVGELNDNYVKLAKFKGEFVWHIPIAEEEAHILLLEPKTVVNTGNVTNSQTVETLEWL